MKQIQVSGTLKLMGSKSILQRIMLICSIQTMQIMLKPASICEDVLEMVLALKSIGVTADLKSDTIIIDSGNLPQVNLVENQVYFTASATAFRFWLARAIIAPNKTIINISEQLHRRPFGSLLQVLDAFGCYAIITQMDDSRFPHQLEISPRTVSLREIDVDSSVSSQYISGLMLMSPLLTDGLTINLSQPSVSAGYIKLTASLMQEFGISCKLDENKVTIPANQHYRALDKLDIEADMSSAAFFLCLGAFSEKGISIGINTRTRWQPDWRIISILREMGVSISETDNFITAGAGELHGIDIDLGGNPDLVPILVSLALFADSPSCFRNITHLKFKESDRVTGLTNAMELLGATYILETNSLCVYPLTNAPAQVVLDTQNDHRLVMAFTLIQLHYPQISLSETQSVAKSCPDFDILLKSIKLGNDNCT